jgi:hypothetical protein
LYSFGDAVAGNAEWLNASSAYVTCEGNETGRVEANDGTREDATAAVML